jgi:hypothetical protein
LYYFGTSTTTLRRPITYRRTRVWIEQKFSREKHPTISGGVVSVPNLDFNPRPQSGMELLHGFALSFCALPLEPTDLSEGKSRALGVAVGEAVGVGLGVGVGVGFGASRSGTLKFPLYPASSRYL